MAKGTKLVAVEERVGSGHGMPKGFCAERVWTKIAKGASLNEKALDRS
jgi:hypothetical protein